MKQIIIILTILLGLSACQKNLYPHHDQGTGIRSLINGASVLLFRKNNLVSNSPAKSPLFEMSLYGELGLPPRNTVTFFPSWNVPSLASSSSFEGVWVSMYAGSFFPENDGRSHFTLSHYLYPIFKAKENLLQVLERYGSILSPADIAETKYLLGLIHYYQYILFGAITHNGKIYPANSSLAPSIQYFTEGLALAALPYKNNKTINDLGAKALLARLYWLNGQDDLARNTALEIQAIYTPITLEKNNILWRVSLLNDDNISINTINYTQAVTVFGDQSKWPIAWVAQAGQAEVKNSLGKDDIQIDLEESKRAVVFTAKEGNAGNAELANSTETNINNGFIIVTLDEINELAGNQNFDFTFRQKHLFNALLNRAIAIRQTPTEVKYIPGYLKP